MKEPGKKERRLGRIKRGKKGGESGGGGGREGRRKGKREGKTRKRGGREGGREGKTRKRRGYSRVKGRDRGKGGMMRNAHKLPVKLHT